MVIRGPRRAYEELAAQQQDAADKRRGYWRAARAFIEAPLAADLGVRRTLGMSERIRLTPAVNRLLWPRLQALGFRIQFPEDAVTWKEGYGIGRVGVHGRRQGLLMGRDKFGHLFGINVSRELPDGTWEYLDLARVGLPRQALSYNTQVQAEAVLERIAEVMKSTIVPWLDEDPPRGAERTA